MLQNAQGQRNNQVKRLEGTVLVFRVYQGQEYCLFPLNRLDKLKIHREFGRGLRRILGQLWR